MARPKAHDDDMDPVTVLIPRGEKQRIHAYAESTRTPLSVLLRQWILERWRREERTREEKASDEP